MIVVFTNEECLKVSKSRVLEPSGLVSHHRDGPRVPIRLEDSIFETVCDRPHLVALKQIEIAPKWTVGSPTCKPTLQTGC